MANKRIEDFATQNDIVDGDKLPFWKTLGGLTSKITFANFITAVVRSIVVSVTGGSAAKVMSQKAVTDLVEETKENLQDQADEMADSLEGLAGVVEGIGEAISEIAEDVSGLASSLEVSHVDTIVYSGATVTIEDEVYPSVVLTYNALSFYSLQIANVAIFEDDVIYQSDTKTLALKFNNIINGDVVRVAYRKGVAV